MLAAPLAGLEHGCRVDLHHWARAQEVVERRQRYAHRLYDQVTKTVEKESRRAVEAGARQAQILSFPGSRQKAQAGIHGKSREY